MLSPVQIGAPKKFTEWRDDQKVALLRIVQSEARFNAHAPPTGAGKSLIGIAAALLEEDIRACYITSTKSLQNQLINDFEEIGLIEVKGRNAYPCRAGGEGVLGPEYRHAYVDQAPCQYGKRCRYKDLGCSYYDKFRAANRASLVVTNYAYWMSINEYGEGLGEFDMLILDEGHSIPAEVSNFVNFNLEEKEMRKALNVGFPSKTNDMEEWREWGGYHHKTAVKEYATISQFIADEEEEGFVPKGTVEQARLLKSLVLRLHKLANVREDWCVEMVGSKEASFHCIWPAAYTHPYLFRNVPKILLLSATLREKTLDLLGVADYEFYEYDSPFPVKNRKLTHIPTIYLNHRSTDSQLRKWVNRMDQIIQKRQDRKGIIHTVSYARRNYILKHSEFAHLMLAHDRRNVVGVVEKFKKAKAPCILVSPSMTTGWDFPDSSCRYQIIGKVPYPDTRSIVMQERRKKDKDYAPYIAMQQLVQCCGRGVRSKTDFCENLIIDDTVGGFMRRYKKFAPKWFHNAFERKALIPTPPKLTEEEN